MQMERLHPKINILIRIKNTELTRKDKRKYQLSDIDLVKRAIASVIRLSPTNPILFLFRAFYSFSPLSRPP